MKSKLRFAIVGCGRIAERHAQHISYMAVLQAVCDMDESKANALANKYGVTAYVALDAMLQNENVDVLVVCTPNGLHASHAIEGLQSGCHVLVEKPMAIAVTDCYAMMDAASKAGKQLFVVKQNRFNPPVVAVREALSKGVLGKLYSIQLNCFWNRDAAYYANSWKGTQDMDGGTLYTQFSHFIDLLYVLAGDVKAAHAFTGNYAHKGIIDFEDTGAVSLLFDNGVIGTVHYTVNSHSKNMEGSVTLFAEKGTVKIGGQYLNELEYQCVESFEFKDLPEGNGPNNYGTYMGSMSNHDKVYENVIAVLERGETVYMNTEDGAKTVEIIEKIYAAANH